ncbi:MAG: hypothetical protein HYY20_02355 [Candidatus Tectomicrobia bacterium]|uniref:Type II secretion system protein GspC N-terminal domain-containing protein n=1 Tax=Tectimicrobiota bacterium TaxID=2528274 RepID=A0A932CLM6_UNCTE|nr:hypothetical protein [Candidatus Tectomicrobia bacterium]
MLKRLALLNLLLAGMTGLLAYKVHEVWNHPSPSLAEIRQKPSPERGFRGKASASPSPSKDSKKPSPEKAFPPMEAYQIIGQTHPFRPDRKEWVPPPPPPPPPAAVVVTPPKPALPPASSFKLYGTMTMPDGSVVALLEGPLGVGMVNPSPLPGRRSPAPFPSPSPSPPGRRTEPGRAKRYRINDPIGGYRVAEIRTDRVLLEGEGQRTEVLLRDPTTPKQRPAAPPPLQAAAQRVPPPPPGASPFTPQPQPGASPFTPQPQPQPGASPFTPQPQPGRPQAALEEEGAVASPPLQAESRPSRGRNRQVIQTPFGPKVIYR